MVLKRDEKTEAQVAGPAPFSAASTPLHNPNRGPGGPRGEKGIQGDRGPAGPPLSPSSGNSLGTTLDTNVARMLASCSVNVLASGNLIVMCSAQLKIGGGGVGSAIITIGITVDNYQSAGDVLEFNQAAATANPFFVYSRTFMLTNVEPGRRVIGFSAINGGTLNAATGRAAQPFAAPDNIIAFAI